MDEKVLRSFIFNGRRLKIIVVGSVTGGSSRHPWLQLLFSVAFASRRTGPKGLAYCIRRKSRREQKNIAQRTIPLSPGNPQGDCFFALFYLSLANIWLMSASAFAR
jgi:hypothetical protein